MPKSHRTTASPALSSNRNLKSNGRARYGKIREALRDQQESNGCEIKERMVMSANGISTERIVADMKLVMRDAEDLLKATADEVGAKTKEARVQLTETLRDAREKCGELEAKAIEGAKAADKTIREHPYQSIGVAFGVGLVLGILLQRK